jgi:hypothetical protein
MAVAMTVAVVVVGGVGPGVGGVVVEGVVFGGVDDRPGGACLDGEVE